ncbi:MAG: hypothetical protein JRI95_05050 [Deltaproteobacteria bacterium]|nr:hypothetical protein [Deltaproteobacteria bacterium]
MKRNITYALVLCIILVFLGTAFAHAQAPQRPMHRAKWGMQWMSPVRSYFVLKRHKENLNLTDEQLARLKEISFSLEEKLLVLKEKNQKLLLEMKKLLDNEPFDYLALEENIKKRAANRAVFFIESLKTIQEAKEIFTEEQLKKISAFSKARFMRKRWMAR